MSSGELWGRGRDEDGLAGNRISGNVTYLHNLLSRPLKLSRFILILPKDLSRVVVIVIGTCFSFLTLQSTATDGSEREGPL